MCWRWWWWQRVVIGVVKVPVHGGQQAAALARAVPFVHLLLLDCSREAQKRGGPVVVVVVVVVLAFCVCVCVCRNVLVSHYWRESVEYRGTR